MGKCLLAIRIRGGVNVPTRDEDNLRMLRMDRNNTATLLDDRPEYLGMLQRAKDCVTWGEPDVGTVRLILEKRGRIPGDKPLDQDALGAMGYESIEALASALHAGEAELHKIEGVK
ncbi:MAG: uL30 family ribosomal protein, partial [Candidatus Bathyarchaeota archaeon]|nr:uL30 family ribosomal protein [Candidatus Bathyarchaeota archaeon]